MVDNFDVERVARIDASLIAEKLRDILELLDRSDVTSDVGAHIDLALCRLEEQIAANDDSFTKQKSFRPD